MAITLFSSLLPFVPSLIMSYGVAYKYMALPDIPSTVKDPKLVQMLQNKFRSFMSETGIRKDVQLHITEDGLAAAAAGGNLTKHALMIIRKGLIKADPQASDFAIKHEFGHIKYSHLIKDCFLGLITSTAIAILFPFFLGTSLPASIAICSIAFLVAGKSIQIYTFKAEEQADDFAIEHATDEQLFGGIRFFKACEILEIDTKENAHHPHPLHRIEKIQRELLRRGKTYKKNAFHTKKISDITNFLRSSSRISCSSSRKLKGCKTNVSEIVEKHKKKVDRIIASGRNVEARLAKLKRETLTELDSYTATVLS